MAGPKHAVATRRGRYYTKDGERFVSVTNVIDTCVNKSGPLTNWAAKLVAEAAVARFADPKTAAAALRAARQQPDHLIAELKGTPHAAKDQAANFGTRIHDLAQSHALDLDLGDLTAEELASIEQYLAFVTDFRPVFLASEATVCNRAAGYAGTLDALIQFPDDLPVPDVAGKTLVVDYKTGRTGPYPEWAVQLAAYRHAETVWLPDGTEVVMPPADGAAVLRIRPDGYALHVLDSSDAVFTIFLRMADVTRWLHNDAEACVGEPVRFPAVVPSPAEVA